MPAGLRPGGWIVRSGRPQKRAMGGRRRGGCGIVAGGKEREEDKGCAKQDKTEEQGQEQEERRRGKREREAEQGRLQHQR